MLNYVCCVVGFCDNDKRYFDFVYVRFYVKNLMFYKWLVDLKFVEIW